MRGRGSGLLVHIVCLPAPSCPVLCHAQQGCLTALQHPTLHSSPAAKQPSRQLASNAPERAVTLLPHVCKKALVACLPRCAHRAVALIAAEREVHQEWVRFRQPSTGESRCLHPATAAAGRPCTEHTRGKLALQVCCKQQDTTPLHSAPPSAPPFALGGAGLGEVNTCMHVRVRV